MTAMHSDLPKSPFNRNTYYHRHATIALSFAITLHCTAIILYYIFVPNDQKEIILRGGHRVIEWVPPPSIDNYYGTPPVRVNVPTIKAIWGIPVSIPELELKNDTLSDEPSVTSGLVDPASTENNGSLGTSDNGVSSIGTIDIDDAPIDLTNDFRSMVKYPNAIKKVSPDYPDLARRIGLEGNVTIKLLIDKDGRAKKAEIYSSDNEMFNEAAMKAALQWTFTPAIMNQNTVSVWDVVPFKFKLNR